MEINTYQDLRDLILKDKLNATDLERVIWSSMSVFVFGDHTPEEIVEILDHVNQTPLLDRGLFYKKKKYENSN
jgi:hypothetical protein